MAGSPFPSREQFEGDFVASAIPAIEGGQSTYEGTLAVTLFDRAVVQEALPERFELARRKDGATTHPVIHMVGHQRSPMLIQQGQVAPAPDPGYQEMILLIPFVICDRGQLWHTFAVRMFLNDLAAIHIGNVYYCYGKAFAALDETHQAGRIDTKVVPVREGEVFTSSVRQTAPWGSCGAGAAVPPGLDEVKTLFSMPMVGTTAAGPGQPPRTVCSYWEWDYTCAEAAPGESDHVFLKEVAAGMTRWLGPASSPAVLIRGLRWRIPLPPQQCLF